MHRHVLPQLVGEGEDLATHGALVLHLRAVCGVGVLAGQVIFQVVLLNELLLAMLTLEMTDSVVGQEVFFKASLLSESLFTDQTGKGFKVCVCPKVQLQTDPVRVNLVTDLAFPILKQTDPPVHMVLQLRQNQE